MVSRGMFCFLFFSCSLFSFSQDTEALQRAWWQSTIDKTTRNAMKLDPVHAEIDRATYHPYAPFYSIKVGCIILAGGQGSRLGLEIPKGCVSIPSSGRTLFEIFFRKAVGFHSMYKMWPYLAIMTSLENDSETRQYLKANHFFGVPKKYVSLFCQSNLPLLNEQGEPYMEGGAIVCAPDGNGKVFASFEQSGIAAQWQEQGVQALLFMPIDNPLMDPFLPALFKPVLEWHEEAAFGAIQRKSATEKTGTFFLRDGRLQVVEYSEISDVLRSEKKPDGSLLHEWANISVGVMSLETVHFLSSLSLPLHFAKKMRGQAAIYKPEYFIFDTFSAISSFSVVGLERDSLFSPVKNKTGEDSLETARLHFQRVQREQAVRAKMEEERVSKAESIDPAELYGF